MRTKRRPVAYHPYQEDPDLPDTCVCGLRDPLRTNQRHKLPDLGEQTIESRRRAGETEEDE